MLELLFMHVIFIIFKHGHPITSCQLVYEAFLFMLIFFCVITVTHFVWDCSFTISYWLSSFILFFIWEGQLGFDIPILCVFLSILILSNVPIFLTASLHVVLLLRVIFVLFICLGAVRGKRRYLFCFPPLTYIEHINRTFYNYMQSIKKE